MSENLSNDEKDFVSNILGSKKNIEVNKEDDEIIVTKVSKKKIKGSKIPGYKKLSNWIAAIFILPFILTGVFIAGLMRLQSYFGGKESLDWISQQEITPAITNTLSDAGFAWFPQFIEIYSNRGIIIAITFTIPILIVAALIVYDVNKNKDELEEVQEDIEESN